MLLAQYQGTGPAAQPVGKIPKAPKYREPCTRDPNTDNRRGCNYLHPDQTELYAHLIPGLPWNAKSKTGPNDDEMDM